MMQIYEKNFDFAIYSLHFFMFSRKVQVFSLSKVAFCMKSMQ